METLGERLQQCRMEKGISLEEIAHITKIKITSLQALEDDDFQSLPSEVYTKSFIKIYASYLGLDGNEFVSEYLAGLPAQKGRPKKIFAIQQPVTVQRRITNQSSRRMPFLLVVFLVAAVVAAGAGGFVFFKKPQLRGKGVFSFFSSSPAQPLSGGAAAAAQGGDGYLLLSPAPAGTSRILRVEAAASVWLSVKIKGTTLFEGLVGAGAKEAWPFADKLTIKISEPDNVSVFLSDKPVSIPAKGVTTLVADSRGIRIQGGTGQ